MRIKIGNLYLSRLNVEDYDDTLEIDFTSNVMNSKLIKSDYLNIIFNILTSQLNIKNEDIIVIYEDEKVGSDNE